ncbi:MAG: diaminopimelate decarboxylase, partial [Synergistales bacterium]|nr:diaminopimelate decarboxylase [Synergistales bacterium]
AVCRIIHQEGLGLDVVSGGELFTAHRSGFPMGKVYFHGNSKTLDEMRMALELGVGTIVVDSFQELLLLAGMSRKRKDPLKILLRLSPGVDVNTHKYISTGHLGSKFGFPLSGQDLRDAVSFAIDHPQLDLRGFHFHLGSMLFDKLPYLMAVNIVMDKMREFSEEIGMVTSELNVGGGFGVPLLPDGSQVRIEDFTDPIMARIRDGVSARGLKMPEVVIEPGRWIVSEAGITLYTVGVIKKIPGYLTYASVDGGMADNPRPALYGARYQAVAANKYDREPIETVTLAGKCCESGDVLIRDLHVPELEPGDIIAVLNTGGYNFSMASNYNRNPRPGMVLLVGKKAFEVVTRQTYEDLVRGEVIPEHLKS